MHVRSMWIRDLKKLNLVLWFGFSLKPMLMLMLFSKVIKMDLKQIKICIVILVSKVDNIRFKKLKYLCKLECLANYVEIRWFYQTIQNILRYVISTSLHLKTSRATCFPEKTSRKLFVKYLRNKKKCTRALGSISGPQIKASKSLLNDNAHQFRLQLNC